MMNKKYTSTHEWIHLVEGIATLGITQYAQHELGEVVFIQLPKIQSHVNAGEQTAVLESTKAASDLYSPISGEIIAVNEALSANPGLINEDPEGSGWLFKIRCSKMQEMDSFMNRAEYLRMIG